MNEKLPKVGVGIIVINNKNQVLLILRNSDANLADSEMHLEGTWTLPAGKMKYDENIIECAIRKVKEETNLDIFEPKIISISDDINEYAHYITIGLVTHTYSGNVDLGITEEHIDYGFFDIDNMPNNLCEPSKKILTNYQNKCIYKED